MSGTLTVVVVSAKLQEDDTKVFVTLWVDDFKQLERKTSHKEGSEIKWNQTFNFPMANATPNSVLHVELYDTHDDTIMGKDDIKLASIIKNTPKETDKWYKLEPSGELQLKLSWQNEGTSKREKRRSGEVSKSSVKKTSPSSERKNKSKSTRYSAATVKEKSEKAKKVY